VESIIERIEKGQFWKYHGGIHPPEMKFLTTDKPILPLTIPKELILPIQQHIGDAGEIIVNVNDRVNKGQPLTKSTSLLSVPIHAPTSGLITAIENATIAHPSGLEELCIKLAPDKEDKWCERQINPDFRSLSKYEIAEKIRQAGIAGMGGAGFPTHVKVSTPEQINYLIINAAECEPYITADDLLIREHCSSIVDGINILEQLLEPAFILIGIEDNKPEAIAALQKATQAIDKIKICILPTKYPTGGEKQLIMALTSMEVPAGVLPSKLGIVMQNIATCYAIADAVIYDTPLIKRVVTVSGQALEKPQNVWALLGTPINFLLESCGYPNRHKKHIIMGGPMMGFSLPNTHVPVVKTTNCILAPSEEEIPDKNEEVECIRCGQCAEVCPAQLLPQELQWSAKAKDHPQLETLNLFDCIECGACAYVCPSHIPLVHYYRISKAEIRQQKLMDVKAEHAKQRFEARKARLEREKIAREEKHRKAAEARKARMNAGTPEANNEKSTVAAALARVKAKKALTQQSINTDETNVNTEAVDEAKSQHKSSVSAAIARAKAKKLAAKKAEVNQPTTTYLEIDESNDKQEKSTTNAADAKKAKIASAIAKAKAKKSQTNDLSNDKTDAFTDSPVDDTTPAVDVKKARIAAAVAKAKAKKSQTNDLSNDKTDEFTDSPVGDTAPAVDEKKARIAAAVAKAKAKKQQAQNQEKNNVQQTTSADENVENTNQINSSSQTEKIANNEIDAAAAKKARIAAAVAKAKAKKQQAESE